MDQEKDIVFGLDNVQVRLPVAAFPTRVLACLADYAAILLLFLGLMLLWSGLSWAGVFGAGSAGWAFAGIILSYFALEYGYFAGCELAMNGQTPGKRLLGLRVATRTGGRPSRGAIFIRNALRSLDIAVGVPLMIWSSLGQRVGDMLAGTVVLESANAEETPQVRRTPRHWAAREVAVAEDFLRRAPLMEAGRARRIAERILEGIEQQDPGFLGPLRLREPLDRLRNELGAGD